MRALRPWLLTAVLLALPGCVLAVAPDATGPQTAANNGSDPVIQAFDYNPKSGNLNDTYTFTLLAADPHGLPLQYKWSATKGTLSSDTGAAVSWRPIKQDGSPDAGLATITVIVSDGPNFRTGSLNIQIAANGSATVLGSSTSSSPAPTATPSAKASASATATASPSATATASPDATATATPSASPSVAGKILYADDFEGGLSNWTTGASALGENTYAWKSQLGGAASGKVSLVLNDGNGQVAAKANLSPVWIQTNQAIDLTSAKLPMCQLDVKNGASPTADVTYNVAFSTTPFQNGQILSSDAFAGSAFNGGPAWKAQTIDLSPYKGKKGYLAVVVQLNGTNDQAFTGPMVDDLVVYDAGQ